MTGVSTVGFTYQNGTNGEVVTGTSAGTTVNLNTVNARTPLAATNANASTNTSTSTRRLPNTGEGDTDLLAVLGVGLTIAAVTSAVLLKKRDDETKYDKLY
jgi:LPXTG-motif cell wall-anchored protein